MTCGQNNSKIFGGCVHLWRRPCGLNRLEIFRVRAVHDWASKFPSLVVFLTRMDGGRCVSCWFGSCHTLWRMSGARRVRVGWIPASCSDILPDMPLQLWCKSNFALIGSWVSCVAYLHEGIRLSQRPSFV